MEDYKKLKKDELIKILKSKNIKFPKNATKSELIKLILESEKEVKKVSSEKKKSTRKVRAAKPSKRKKVESIESQTEKKEEIEVSLPPETYIKDEIEKFHQLPDFKFLKRISFEIPPSYNFHKLVLLVVDPYWIYSYWEIKNEIRESLISQYGADVINQNNLYLMLYEGESDNKFMEIKVNSFKGNWFINVNRPDSLFKAKLGFKDRAGNFIEVLSSNLIKTPRDRESSNMEQLWAYLDIDKPISLEFRKMVKKYLDYKLKFDFTSSFGSIYGSHSILKKKQ